MLPLPGTVITTITVQFGWGDPYKTSLSTATGRMSITHLPCLARSKGNARNRPLKPWPRCGNASRNGKAYGRRRAENRSTDGDAWNKSAGWKMVEVCHCFCRGSGGWVRVFFLTHLLTMVVWKNDNPELRLFGWISVIWHLTMFERCNPLRFVGNLSEIWWDSNFGLGFEISI